MKVRRLGFRPDVQGLRAIAVLLVVIYHAGVPWLSGGYIGVDVFFVISGFLITAHLASELGTHGRIRFATFYARRIRRILPASLAVVALSVVATVLWIPPLLQARSFKESIFTALYVPNFYFAGEKVDYLSNPNPSIFQHFWSLGVEEQFYLVWPAAIAIVFLLTRTSVKGLIRTLVAVFVLGLAGSVWLTERSQPLAFFMMPSRAWEFALGGILALVATATAFTLAPMVRWILGWGGVIALVVCGVVYDGATVFPGTAAIIPVVATACVIAAGSFADAHGRDVSRLSASAALSVRPMVFVGTISYSLYLVHWPLLTIPQIAVGDQRPLPLWATVALAVVGIPMAWLLYRFIETPLRAPRQKSWPTMVIAAGVSVCLVLACGVTYRASIDRQFRTDTAVENAAPATTPHGTAFVPKNMSPSVEDASKDNPEIYANGCHLSEGQSTLNECLVKSDDEAPTVMLFGDSHAAQWYPALADLAERGIITLMSNTKSNCAAYEVPAEADCETWRGNVVQSVHAERPDLTIITGYTGRADTRLPPAEWQSGIERSIDELQDSTHVVVMTDNPQFGMDPATCLSGHLDDAESCGAPRSEALISDSETALKKAAESESADVLDMTEYLCNSTFCPVVIGNTLAYRDAHHISATFSLALADSLWRQLSPLITK